MKLGRMIRLIQALQRLPILQALPVLANKPWKVGLAVRKLYDGCVRLQAWAYVT